MKNKIKQFQLYLKKKKIDFALFIDLSFQKKDPNLFYFAGIDLEYCGLAIPNSKSPFLIAPGFEYERAKKILKGKIKVVKPTLKKGFLEEVKQQLKGMKIKTIGINENIISSKELKSIKKTFKRIKLIDISKELLELRSTKTKVEINKIRKSCLIASNILKDCFKNFNKLKTERDVLRFLKLKTLENDCELAFEPIVASGANASYPHHKSANIKLKKGFGLIDFGVKYEGYCSDITRTFYIGKPTKKDLNLYNFILNTQENAIKASKIGRNLGDISKEVSGILGPNFIHGLGHGIGVEIHEFPNLKSNSNEKIKDGMIYTIEPGYYIKDKLGIRIEDDVLISGKNPIILTKITKKLQIFLKK